MLATQRIAEAEAVARDAVARWPDHPFGWKALAAVLAITGRPADSLHASWKALELLPTDAELHNYAANSLHALGMILEAEAAYRRSLALKPDYGAALENLGNLLVDCGKLAEAAECFRRAAALNPAQPIMLKLGNVLRDLGRPGDAAEVYGRAVELAPQDPIAHNNLGNALRDLGELSAAEQSYRTALSIRPNHAEVISNLGVVLRHQGKLADAERCYREALRLQPGYYAAFCNLGDVLRETGRFEEAERCYLGALNAAPNSHAIHAGRGTLLREMGRATDAVASFQRSLELNPGDCSVQNDLGNAFVDLGRFDDARAAYRRAIAIKPDFAAARSNLLFLGAYADPEYSDAQLRAAVEWERSIIPEPVRAAAQARAFGRTSRAGRSLRVGYVSGDFRIHAVSNFIASVLKSHDRRRVEVFAYSACGIRDRVTELIESEVDNWRKITGLSDDEAARMIDDDEIDVLIDLSGHTAHNRLAIFARRAAPIQCHYLGYIGSTGLSTMDYFIADPDLVPEAHDRQYRESVWRLPRVWASYAPLEDAPAPARAPVRQDRTCLGSFNHLRKVTERTIALWARVLLRIPDAYLLLKTKELDDPERRSRLAEAFERLGVPISRLSFLGRTDNWRAHMSAYGQVDVALDPVGGHGGATTTCDALWMGVPVVTLAGGRYGERMSHAILAAIRRSEWSAANEEQYIENVVRLAADVPARQEIRLSLREEMRRSPLTDATGLARALEDAYEAMFDRWASRQPR